MYDGSTTQQFMKIIIIDDEEDDRDYLRLILERGGHTVILENDAVSAIESIVGNYEDIDLIITDLRMPRMNGIEFIGHLKSVRPEARVWLVSSHIHPLDSAEALLAGAEKALQKMEIKHELLREKILTPCARK